MPFFIIPPILLKTKRGTRVYFVGAAFVTLPLSALTLWSAWQGGGLTGQPHSGNGGSRQRLQVQPKQQQGLE